MKITVEILTCEDCRDLEHSGAFTKGGARPVCGHEHAVDMVRLRKPHIVTDDIYHWRHRQIKKFPKIPTWCPLKSGFDY